MDGKCVEKIYSDDILFDDEEGDTYITANSSKTELQFDIDKLKKAKTEIDLNLFEPGYVVKKMYFVSHKLDDVYKYFDFEAEPVGFGSFGTVYKAIEKGTDIVRAIKVINIDHLKTGSKYNNFINEVTSLKMLDHPNIIKLYEVYEYDSKVFLVQEY